MVGMRQVKAAALGGLCLLATAFAPPSTPAERWQAIAVRDDFRVFGMSQVNNMPSRDAAVAQAMHNCVTSHGGSCSVMAATLGCVAVAYNEGQLAFFSATGSTAADASLKAQNYCAGQGVYCDKKLVSCPWPMPK